MVAELLVSFGASTVCQRRCALGLLLALLMAGCEARRYDVDCGKSFDEDPGYRPTQGVFELDYVGWAGRAPKNAVRMHVRTATETLYMQGCGYEGDNFWWVDAAVGVPATVTPPAAFGTTIEEPRASVRLWTCDVYDCDGIQRKASLATAEGTLHQYDNVAGILRADYRLSDTREGTLETGTMGVHADITWTPE